MCSSHDEMPASAAGGATGADPAQDPRRGARGRRRGIARQALRPGGVATRWQQRNEAVVGGRRLSTPRRAAPRRLPPIGLLIARCPERGVDLATAMRALDGASPPSAGTLEDASDGRDGMGRPVPRHVDARREPRPSACEGLRRRRLGAGSGATSRRRSRRLPCTRSCPSDDRFRAEPLVRPARRSSRLDQHRAGSGGVPEAMAIRRSGRRWHRRVQLGAAGSTAPPRGSRCWPG